MPSNYATQAKSLMGHPQPYDDSKLRKRTSLLISGLLLCFIIAIASLVISVMLLLKDEDTLTSESADKTQEVHKHYNPEIEQAIAKSETLEKQLQELLIKIDALSESKAKEALDTQFISNLPPVDLDGPYDEPQGSGDDEIPDYYLDYHDYHDEPDSSEHEAVTHPDHVEDSEVVDHTEPSQDVSEDSSHNHSHHNIHKHHHVHQNQPVESTTAPNNGHSKTHNDSSIPSEDAAIPQPKVTFEKSKEELDQLSDPPVDLEPACEGQLCFEDYEEGSGTGFTFDDSSGGYLTAYDDESPNLEAVMDSEGVGCMDFPRPACPEGFSICYTKDRCPVPVCCLI